MTLLNFFYDSSQLFNDSAKLFNDSANLFNASVKGYFNDSAYFLLNMSFESDLA
jgi:hypothetical protein